MKNKLIYALVATLLISCGGPAVTQLPQRSFPKVKLPSLIQDSAQAAEYLALHWWDPLTDTTTLYLTDSTHILGVENSSVEQEMSNYTAILSFPHALSFSLSPSLSLFLSPSLPFLSLLPHAKTHAGTHSYSTQINA